MELGRISATSSKRPLGDQVSATVITAGDVAGTIAFVPNYPMCPAARNAMLDLLRHSDEGAIGEIAARHDAIRSEAGKDSEQRFRDLLQALPAAIYTTDG